MVAQTREAGPDALHRHGASRNAAGQRRETPLRMLAPAFMVSELRRAFEIGFMLFVPVPHHRPGGVVAADGDGDDDDAAGDDQLAVQVNLLRAGGRLAAGRRQPDRELSRAGVPPGG